VFRSLPRLARPLLTLALSLVLCLGALTLPAFAQPADPGADPVAFGALVLEAITGRNWPLLAGLVLTFIVWGLRTWVLQRVSSKVLPWIVLVAAVLAEGAAVLFAGGDWLVALVQGLLVGFVSMGSWDLSAIFRKD